VCESAVDQRVGAGEGCRRRRLTLAPRTRDGSSAKVSLGGFADSGGDKGAVAESSVASSTGAPACFACSSVGSSSELAASFVDATNGSRFWALGSEEDSEDEAPAPPAEPPAASEVAVQVQGTEQLNASAMRGKEICRKLGGSGWLLEPHPKLMQRQRPACNPWRGPLPTA
jgi:hypothetical protein